MILMIKIQVYQLCRLPPLRYFTPIIFRISSKEQTGEYEQLRLLSVTCSAYFGENISIHSLGRLLQLW